MATEKILERGFVGVENNIRVFPLCIIYCYLSKDKKKELLGLLKEDVVLTSVLNLDGILHMCMHDQVFKYKYVT